MITSIHDILTSYLINKKLRLYKFSWVDRTTAKNRNIEYTTFQTEPNMGSYQFNYNTQKWQKLHLETMKIEAHEFEILNINFSDDEYDNGLEFQLKDFEVGTFPYLCTNEPTNIFKCSIYDKIEII